MKNRAEKYIEFEEQPNPGKKSRIWLVIARKEECVGRIAWRGAWRKYVLEPLPNMVFDQDCMRLIADFCEDRTRKQLRP